MASKRNFTEVETLEQRVAANEKLKISKLLKASKQV